ncbi:MAG TPA: carboxylesterase family protein [Candidatus Binatia bacterium]|nr:carboxylesterase family protein [Candidatus Binatia bacterium]
MTVIELRDGPVRGVVAGDVASWKGIPYAAPPVGSLRWRSPQPVDPWREIRDAAAFGDDCVQAPGSEPIRTATSEDCLFVNVWAPARREPAARLPVMVWIHGGGYVGGGSSIPYYDGSAFARHGIVVVSFNYRLGRFGFFAHPALLAAAEGPVGNYGYLDQIRALEWVRDNIDRFGGDPARVTVVGESAGGASVIHLVVSPVVDGLFHQAMSLSGAGRKALLARPLTRGRISDISARRIDSAFGLAHGIRGDGPKALGKLRAIDAATLAGDENLEKLGKIKLLGGSIPGIPAIDGTIVVGEPEDHLVSGGDAKRVPLLIGSTALDVPLHFPPRKLDPLAWFGPERAAAREAYDAPDHLDLEGALRLLLAIGADMTMHEPAHFLAASMLAGGRPAWVYRFTYTAESTRPGAAGQVHAGELPFLFDTLESRYGAATTSRDQATARAFNAYVSNFVRRGDPNGPGLPAWPMAEPGRFEVLDFSLDDGPVFGPEPRAGVELVARARDRHRAAG